MVQNDTSTEIMCHHRSDMVTSNKIRNLLTLIDFLYLKCTSNSNFNIILRKILQTNDFELTVSDLCNVHLRSFKMFRLLKHRRVTSQ